MPDKTLTYIQLAQDTARQITSNYRSWTAYLSTASRLYKYQYSDQLLIHAQRPDATACAEYDLWNNTMHRYVRRGSKGIALLHNNAGQLSLRYVFDVSDTGTRRTSLDPFLWQINERNESAIAAMLEQEYAVSATHGLHFQLAEIAQRQTSAYWQDHQQDIFRIVDGSYLEEYDEINVRESFRRAASISTCYILQARCGLDVDSQFEHEDFLNVFDWNTPDAVAVLGTAISQISGQVLRQIEMIAKRVERSVENDRDAVHDEGRLPVSEPDHAESAQPAPEQVREDAGEVSGGAEADPVPDDAPERNADEPPAGDQRNGEPSPGTDDAGDVQSDEPDGGTEGQRPNGLDAADEQSESPGRGDPAGGADLQLSFLDGSMAIPTEAEQIHSIDEAERALFAPFAFSVPQEDIYHILRIGSNTTDHRMIMVAEFSKQKPLEEMTAALRRVYHGGYGIATEHGRVTAWYAEDGIVATHKDKQHIHNHIIFHSVNLDCDRKFRNFFNSTRALHRLSDTICIENGYSIVADPKRHGQAYNKWLGDRAKLPQREAIRILIDDALAQKPADLDALLELLKAVGCEIKRGKQISIRGPGQTRFKRLDTLGEAYDLPALTAILAGERQHQPRQQRQSPDVTVPKVNLLVDIQAQLRAGKGHGYERWAKRFNIKQIAQTLNYLTETGLLEYSELKEKADQAEARCNGLQSHLQETEAKLTANAVLQTHILNYIKTREIYAAYHQSGYSKKFLAEHESEIALHRAAKKAFNELGFIGTYLLSSSNGSSSG